MSPQEIEFRSLHNSHCLERIAEQSAEAGESMTAIRARTALASVLARLQILASTPSHPEANGGKPRRRIRLGDSRGSGLPIPDGVIW
jgi:hypothetical protein